MNIQQLWTRSGFALRSACRGLFARLQAFGADPTGGRRAASCMGHNWTSGKANSRLEPPAGKGHGRWTTG